MHLLQDKQFPINEIKLLSSKRSAGKKMRFNNKEITVEEENPESLSGIDIDIFSAGGAVSKKLAPEAVKHGAIVIDNTSAFRMAEDVPLIVHEVNADDLNDHQEIIANPN